MSIAVILSSEPLDLASVDGAVSQMGANVKALPISDVELDENDRSGVADLMAYVRAEHGLCLRDMSVALYEPSVFDALFDQGVVSKRADLIVSAVRAGNAGGARLYVALLNEWDGLGSTRLLRGSIDHLRQFLEVNGGWPSLRFIDARPRRVGELQADYGTVIFQVER